MPQRDNARGLNGVIGERMAEGRHRQRVIRVAPRLQDLHRDLPPAACTASVMMRCLATCHGNDSCDARGSTRPAKFGAMPPVTMRPDAPAGALA
jgi:hypothetical protein